MHPAENSDAKGGEDIVPLILKQGAWTRCLDCQDARIKEHIRTKATITKHTAEDLDICKICAERFPDLRRSPGLHRCAVCRQQFALNTKWERCNHKSRPQVKLVCARCQEDGYTSHDVRKYTCANCDRQTGYANFPEGTMRNFKARLGTTWSRILICRNCARLPKCSVCHNHFQKELTTDQRKKNNRARVCDKCREAGFTPTDKTAYECSACRRTAGRSQFATHSLKNFLARRSMLTCKQCAERLTTLRDRLKKSKRICKCNCLIHTARCPLTPVIYRERRWPGSDGHITRNDCLFLDRLPTPPDWWIKAWGKPIKSGKP